MRFVGRLDFEQAKPAGAFPGIGLEDDAHADLAALNEGGLLSRALPTGGIQR